MFVGSMVIILKLIFTPEIRKELDNENGSSTPIDQQVPHKKPPNTNKEQQNQPIHIVTAKIQPKVHATIPFNIVENMKTINITMSMWYFLAILVLSFKGSSIR